MRTIRPTILILACCLAALASGCTINAGTSPVQTAQSTSHEMRTGTLKVPALIAVNGNTGALEYWPIHPGGGGNVRRISGRGIFRGFGMVANGRVVSFASQSPPEILQFNVDTKAISTLPDPYGSPVDIAIGKDASLYVINATRGNGNVVMYPGGAPNPKELVCSSIGLGENIAVDNEGDIFVEEYIGRSVDVGIVEFPNGPNGPESNHCYQLRLGLGYAYTAGLVVDPKTDDLVALTNPDLCAGGVEGLMTIYTKPYRAKTARSVLVGRNCSGGLRLNADSTIVFVLDDNIGGGSPSVLQRSFPGGRHMGVYGSGQSTSITTIPNTLPN